MSHRSGAYRSSLMTGRYSLRTGIRDTYNGGAIMSMKSPSQNALVQVVMQPVSLANGIWVTNYPSWPQDQGFDESLIHLSGGWHRSETSPPGFKGDSAYLTRCSGNNGQQQHYQGYCTDVCTDAALEFIEKATKSVALLSGHNAPTHRSRSRIVIIVLPGCRSRLGVPADQPFPKDDEK